MKAELSAGQVEERVASITRRMKDAGLPALAVQTFCRYYRRLLSTDQTLIHEADISPVASLPDAGALSGFSGKGEKALSKAVLVKLNGGLGTSMGLQHAKTLLPVKNDLTFLDIIIQQVLHLREETGCSVPLIFMNSFSTDADTLEVVKNYPALLEKQGELPVGFLQHKVPKIDRQTLGPVEFPDDPDLTWCPPGHGDLYTALITSGVLDQLLDGGYEYAFVSNADNLGAVMDTSMLGYFANENFPFMMEVTDRTLADSKGGHLAQSRDGGLLLREVAQCPDEDLDHFQDISRHRYFNTNSLWINLTALKRWLDEQNNIVELPLIVNRKTVDPKDETSRPVYQLETAMGSAISAIPGAAALRVPRTRFTPVKTTNDLLLLWSDAYLMTEDMHIVRTPECEHMNTVINLDKRFYKTIGDFRLRFAGGAPSLKYCSSLTVNGDFRFEEHVRIEGDITLSNSTPHPVTVPAGTILRSVAELQTDE